MQQIPESNIKYVQGYKLSDKYLGYILNYSINNFKIYVNNTQYFVSTLAPLVITTDHTKSKWDDSQSYYRVCFSVYCVSYCYGVSMEQLTRNNEVNPIITCLIRFHLYFTVRLLRRVEGGTSMSDISREFGASEFYGNIEHIHRNTFYRTKGGITYYLYTNSTQNDYKRSVVITSNVSPRLVYSISISLLKVSLIAS